MNSLTKQLPKTCIRLTPEEPTNLPRLCFPDFVCVLGVSWLKGSSKTPKHELHKKHVKRNN
jgi:hypothetical protein